MNHELMGVVAFVISVGAGIPYTIGILQHKVRPERVAWLIWMLLGIVYFIAAIRDHGAVLYTVGELIGPGVAFLLAIKYGVGGKSKFDVVALALALVAISLLFGTTNTIVSLLLAIFADGIGAVLTIRKLHIDPTSEPRMAWVLIALSAVFALLSLNVVTIETLLFPCYVLVFGTYVSIVARPSKVHNAKIDKL